MKKLCFLMIYSLLNPGLAGQAEIRPDTIASKLKIELHANKIEYLPLEPIFFEVSILNRGGSDIDLDPDTVFRQLYVEVVKPDGSTISASIWSDRIISTSRPIPLPGPTSSIRTDSTYRRSIVPAILDVTSDQVGKYRLRLGVQRIGGLEELMSNPIDIEIVEPAGIDRAAYLFLKEKQSDLWLGTLGSYDDESVFREFVAKFGSSSYREYATFFLAKLLLNSKKDLKYVDHLLDNLKNSSNMEISRRASDLKKFSQPSMIKPE